MGDVAPINNDDRSQLTISSPSISHKNRDQPERPPDRSWSFGLRPSTRQGGGVDDVWRRCQRRLSPPASTPGEEESSAGVGSAALG